MSNDFRTNQIEVQKIILSGGIGPKGIGGMIYSGSSATDRAGAHPLAMTADVGSDVQLFVSGVQGGKGTTGTTLYGGDVVFSGSVSTYHGVFRNIDYQISSFSVASDNHFLLISGSAHVTASLQTAAAAGKGRILVFKDDGGNAATNNIVIKPNGSDKIEGVNDDMKIQVNSGSLSLISDGVAAYYVYAFRD